MKKAVILLLVLTIAGLSFASCKFDDVHYCFECGSSNIKELRKEVIAGKEQVVYECKKCNKRFIATEGGIK